VLRWWSLSRRVREVDLGFVGFMYIVRGRDWPVGLRVATWGNLGAAVHRHSLVRLNAINDSSKNFFGYL